MLTRLYFFLKYLFFTFTTRLAYSDTNLRRLNLFGVFDDVIIEFHCISDICTLKKKEERERGICASHMNGKCNS